MNKIRLYPWLAATVLGLMLSATVGWAQDLESLAKHWEALLNGKRKPGTEIIMIAYGPQNRPATIFSLQA